MKLLKWLDKYGELFICSLALVGLFICMVLSVFFRYVLNNSLTWVEELGCYFFVWFSLVGVAYSTKEGAHLRVDVIVNLVPRKLRIILNFVSEFIMTLFFLYMSIEGMKAIISIMENGTTSPAMRMPMWILYLSFWLGCILSLLRWLQSWLKKIIKMKENRERRGKEC